MENRKRRTIDWWIYAIPVLLLLTVLFHLALYSRPGRLAIAIYYLGPILVSMLSVLFLLIGLIYSAIKRPFFSKWRLAGFIGLLVFPILYFLRADQSGNFFNAYPSSYENKPSQVKFRVPFDSAVLIGWGGDDADVNYHVAAPDQRWAYDILMVKGERSYSGDSTQLENYYCYGEPVLAPCAGKVVEAVDTEKDMRIGDLSNEAGPSGNYLIIEVAKGQFLHLCHLKPHSLLVKKGDTVTESQVLAQVGNSGHTSEPHLHIHLQSGSIDFGEGIPLLFHHYSSGGKYVARGMPKGGFEKSGKFLGEIIRNVASR
jgi:hypothetical protein